MNSIVPGRLSLFPIAADNGSDHTEVLLTVIPIGQDRVLAVYPETVACVTTATLSANLVPTPASVHQAAKLYADIVVLRMKASLYLCQVDLVSGLSSFSHPIDLPQLQSKALLSCIAASGAGLIAVCSLCEDCSLSVHIYRDECTGTLPVFTFASTLTHQIEPSALNEASQLRLDAFFDPMGLFLAVQASDSDGKSHILVLTDADSSYFDVTFPKQLCFDSGLRAKYRLDIPGEQVGWVPCGWRSYAQPIRLWGFTSDGRFLVVTNEQSKPNSDDKSMAQAATVNSDYKTSGCCKGDPGSTCGCQSQPPISVSQKFIPYEGRQIALESVEDVTWTPSSYMQDPADLAWYKDFYGMSQRFMDNLVFTANNAVHYPASVWLYDPIVLRNPHIVFPLRTLDSEWPSAQLMYVCGVSASQFQGVCLVYRCEQWYYVAIYTSSSYVWRLAAEFLLPCSPGLKLAKSALTVTSDLRLFCILSNMTLASLSLHSLIQQSYTGAFTRIQDGMVVYADLTLSYVPPPAYNACLLRSLDPIVAAMNYCTIESNAYVAVLTCKTLYIVAVTPFESVGLASEAPAISGDTSFQEQEMLIQSDSVVAKVMNSNKKAHFQTLNDLEDGQRNVSYDIASKEELLIDPFRSDTLQDYIPTHISVCKFEQNVLNCIDEKVRAQFAQVSGRPLLTPIAMTRGSGAQQDGDRAMELVVYLLGWTTGDVLARVVLKLTFAITPEACTLLSSSTAISCDCERGRLLSPPVQDVFSNSIAHHSFYFKSSAADGTRDDSAVAGLSGFASSYYIKWGADSDTDTDGRHSKYVLFGIPRTVSRLCIYLVDLSSPERVHDPIYMCRTEPWSTILWATDLSVTLYVYSGYIDVKCPSRLAYIAAKDMLGTALSRDAPLTDVLNTCFRSRLLLSAISLDIKMSEAQLDMYLQRFFSSDPVLLLRVLEAVVCPYEMKTCADVIFSRYNTTEDHEIKFWSAVVSWMFGNMRLIRDTSMAVYNMDEALYTTLLKALLRILQVHAAYYSGRTCGFGYSNKSARDRVLVELAASFIASYIIVLSDQEKPCLVDAVTGFASAATSYQIDLILLLQRLELCLLHRGCFVDMRSVADAMGLPLNVAVASCLNLSSDAFVRCCQDPLLRAYAYLTIATNGAYTTYTTDDVAGLYGYDSAGIFPYASKSQLSYQCTSIYTYLDLSFHLLSSIFTHLGSVADLEASRDTGTTVFQLDTWESESIGFEALKHLNVVLVANINLLVKVIQEYPLSEYIIRLSVCAASVGPKVAHALLNVFLSLSTASNEAYEALRGILPTLASVDMALHIQLLSTKSSSSLPLLPNTTSYIDTNELSNSTISATSDIQGSLVKLLFTKAKERCTAQQDTTVNAQTTSDRLAISILSDLERLEPSDALFHMLCSLMSNSVADAGSVFNFIKKKLITDGVAAFEEQRRARQSEYALLLEQHAVISAKISAHGEKHTNQEKKTTRPYKISEKMKHCESEIQRLSDQVHILYTRYGQLLTLCLFL